MKPLTIYPDHFNDSTSVSNQFIDNYMKDANDAQIKIYLYLLRMMGGNLPTSISEMADKFNHTEKDVMRALKYWEKNRLLTLDYDSSKNITGIHMKSLSSASCPDSAASFETADSPAETAAETAEIVPITPGINRAVKREESAQEPQQSAAPAARMAVSSAACTLDELKAFREQADTEQLLFIVEQYIGKPLSTSNIKTIFFLCDTLHFSADLVDYLVQYCVDRGKKDFRYIEKVALSWAEQNITTPRQAASMIKKYDKNVYGIMNALGKTGSPTEKEMEYINRWSKQYGFSPEIIKEACDRTVLATDKHRFEYAESILANWDRERVRHISDIRAADERYQKAKGTQTSSKSGSNKFNQFAQNDYDFDQLEKELLRN